MEKLDEALALMRRSLKLIDECDDPSTAGPHLDLAINRLEGAGVGVKATSSERPLDKPAN